MKIDFFTIADLGQRLFNLKTTEAVAIIEALHKLGVVPRIRSRSGGRYQSVSIFPGIQVISRLLTLSKILGVRKDAQYLNFWLLDFFSSRKVFPETEVVFSMLPFSPLLFAKTKAKKVVYGPTSHWAFSERVYAEECDRIGLNCDERFLRRKTQKFVETVNRADRLVVLSNWAKRTYLDEGVAEAKLVVVDQGVNWQKYHFARPANNAEKVKFKVLLVADCTLLKGLQYLLQAWAYFQADEFELNVVGYLDQDVRKILQRYPNYENVFYRGHLNPVPFYREADLFVLPSLSEGSARVVYEASAAALPCIVTNRCGSESLIENGRNGFIVPVRDSQAIAKKVEYLFKHPQERQKMGKRVQAKVSKFTWERFGQKVADAILGVWDGGDVV